MIERLYVFVIVVGRYYVLFYFIGKVCEKIDMMMCGKFKYLIYVLNFWKKF